MSQVRDYFPRKWDLTRPSAKTRLSFFNNAIAIPGKKVCYLRTDLTRKPPPRLSACVTDLSLNWDVATWYCWLTKVARAVQKPTSSYSKPPDSGVCFCCEAAAIGRVPAAQWWELCNALSAELWPSHGPAGSRVEREVVRLFEAPWSNVCCWWYEWW